MSHPFAHGFIVADRSRLLLLMALCAAPFFVQGVLAAQAAAVSDSARYPVQMSSDYFTLGSDKKPFNPGDRTAWQAFFSQPFLDPDGKPQVFTTQDMDMQLFATHPQKNGAMQVGNCKALFQSSKKGYGAPGFALPIYRAWASRCDAGIIVSRMTAADASHVSSFALNVKTVGLLPATMHPAVSKQGNATLAKKQQQGETLADLLKSAKITYTAADKTVNIDYPGGKYSQSLRVLARGDYDHDGVQDLLLQDNWSFVGGGSPYIVQTLFVLTRQSNKAALKVVYNGLQNKPALITP